MHLGAAFRKKEYGGKATDKARGCQSLPTLDEL
jgi:hypothetical protein